MKAVILSILILCVPTGCGNRTEPGALPEGFVSLAEIDPSVQLDIRYYTANNFMGRRVKGYLAPACVLTESAARGLRAAQRLALADGYSLKVYDCYRPQQAVNDFVEWAADPGDTAQRQRFFPAVPKEELFSRGYLAERSGHSRGSTVDLTLVPVASRQPEADSALDHYDCRRAPPQRYPDNSLEMGTGYDCFDELSHTDNPAVSEEARRNRDFLRTLMAAAGFRNYPREWWHFTLEPEPFPESYFDFPVR